MMLIVMVGCGHPTDNEQLVAADSLLAQNRGEEALQMLQMLNTSSFNHHDKAYLALLTTQANLACNITATSDEDINEARQAIKTSTRQHDTSRPTATRRSMPVPYSIREAPTSNWVTLTRR